MYPIRKCTVTEQSHDMESLALCKGLLYLHMLEVYLEVPGPECKICNRTLHLPYAIYYTGVFFCSKGAFWQFKHQSQGATATSVPLYS